MNIKHLTVRFAWHDSGWNGKICKNPSGNIYCRGNYSLLSSRIQRRINLEFEDSNRGASISEVVAHGYLPPCYWCINAFGEEKCTISDPHPFSDLEWMREMFKSVEPLMEEIEEFSIFTWCFKLSFAEEGSPEGRYPADLEERIKKYLNKIVPGKSVVFFYANYSNPVTGDDYKRLLLGAALVREVKPPKRYKFPRDVLKKIRGRKDMQNFSKIAWQFKIKIDPETAFVLPYHRYLEWIDEAKDDKEKDKRLKLLNEIAIPIDEPTLYPAFKYVSMQISHDQAIYLTYLFKRSLKKMKEHKLVPNSVLEDISQKIEKILSILWKVRGKYPGFKNAVRALLKNDLDLYFYFCFDGEKIIEDLKKLIEKKCGDISSYLEGNKRIRTKDIILKEALNKLEKEKEKLAFLSLFDFSVTQMERIMKIIDRKGFKTIKMNPYLLVEEYTYDQKEHWNWDESDSGIGIYHIDIALIPDRNYANWNFDGFDATTPQRIRAIISNILYRAAFNHGNTYLTRKEIIEEIRKYTLYYIGEELDIKESKLKEYESLEIFREKFIIDRDPETGEVIYQLKSIRKLEEKIENVIKTMLKKTYTIGPDAEDFIRKAVTSDLSKVQIKINKEVVRAEREKVYRNALKKGLLIISGRAGTGKTQAIVNLIKYFRNNTRGKIFVFSPTGKSNLVIRNRLREFGLHNDSMIKVSTIHRFLYGGVIDTIEEAGLSYSKDIRILYSLITQILDGKVELFEKFEKFARRWRLSPSVVIIDEASMVDELILAVLFAMINERTLEHLIIVGDEKQLPPIGIGRPFLDIIFFLKKKGYNDNIVYLKTNLRFPSDSLLGKLSSIFAEDEKPTIKELEQLCAQKDDTMEIIKFRDINDLKRILRKILMEILGVESSDKTLFELFKDIFNREKNMEFVQILTPRRVGDFGTLSLNLNVIMEGNPNIIPGSKLICEENIYIDVERYGRRQRVLGLANGSIGYLKDNGDPGFREIEDIFSEYGRDAGIRLVRRIREEIENPLKTDRIIDFAYAITVHKSQGSDFDYVILVLKDVTSFITRELIYTALTRAKRKLYILVHEHLAEKLPLILLEIYNNSAIEKIKTMLFQR